MSREVLSLAATDLACYAVATHPEFELVRHTHAIIEKLEAVERGEIKRLMILCPPRHGKSMSRNRAPFKCDFREEPVASDGALILGPELDKPPAPQQIVFHHAQSMSECALQRHGDRPWP
jgi:hypothetical protein